MVQHKKIINQASVVLASTIILQWVLINSQLSAISKIWRQSMNVQNCQWYTWIKAEPDSFHWKIYTGWLRRLNGQGPSKHLIYAALFVYDAFTPMNKYVCKRKKIYFWFIMFEMAMLKKILQNNLHQCSVIIQLTVSF